MANLATKIGVEGDAAIRIHTPLIDLTKAEIIQRGNALGVDYGATLSCYDLLRRALRALRRLFTANQALEENGLVDSSLK